MKLKKVIDATIPVDYMFRHGSLKIDCNYFIKAIDKGVVAPDNINYSTNVKGLMTSWNYFNKDDKFIETILPLFDYLDNQPEIKKYYLESAWGIKEGFTHYTRLHDHIPNYISGIIYLNSHSQVLLFPQLKEKIIPEKGDCILFSSFLKHKTLRNTTKINKYAIAFNLKEDIKKS